MVLEEFVVHLLLNMLNEVTKSREFRDGTAGLKLQASKGDLHYKFSIQVYNRTVG